MMFGRSGSAGNGSGGGSESLGGGGGQFRHHQTMLPPLPLHLRPTVPISPTAGGGGVLGGDDEFPRRDERVPPWSNQETRDFIAIRAELERDFASAKRSTSKALWEVVAAKMKELGYRRTAEQCKCKWKNLVNRYKGKETSDADSGRQCPFFEELCAVFTARENNMQQLQLESEVGPQRVRKRVRSADQSSEEFSEEEDNDYESDDDRVTTGSVASKKKAQKEKRPRPTATDKSSKNPASDRGNRSTLEGIHELLCSFIQQQLRIEMQWRESMEKCSKERELFEQEWRQTMEKLEKDRIMLEQAWREREEQRRIREESRAEKRDALLTMLLNKLINENQP
ncbi:trihelix transcription factor GT-3b-like [Ipomoea triloba]|uniref:trihelix transcription factor GT-3b-like n=1 Tax=Ipomoea triloba TaxID=35885 RepID=UPI00125E4171|nr:trihelix transcription factor GT-3b-like [Ipomoea triloba]